MARIKQEVGPQLAAAYAELMKRGAAVTVRSLRAEAGVATADAAAWLRVNRAATDVPAVPSEELAGAVGALWAVAVAVARDEAVTERAAREAELLDAEVVALEIAAQAEARIAELQAENEAAAEASAREIEQLRTSLSAVTAQLSEVEARAESEGRVARDAETRAVRAEATVETLQRLVDEHLTRKDRA